MLALLGRQRARLRRHQPLADMDLAVGRLQKSRDQPQRRGLAAAGRARAGRPVVHGRFSRRRYRPPQASQIAWSGRANQRTPIASLPLLFLHGSAPGLVCQYTDKCGMGKGVELGNDGRHACAKLTRGFHMVRDAAVGWVERSETHHRGHGWLMGFASLHPSYKRCRSGLTPPHSPRDIRSRLRFRPCRAEYSAR